jgi:branched-subunit amino acid aminotransferase/4-amino-4-deoxychorismate lyase
MTMATVNGVPATPGDLVPLAFAGYGHYTSMQLRAGRVHGLPYHLERLRAASLELFGAAVPDERVREYIRRTAGGDASVMVHMFASGFLVDIGRPVEPSVLVRSGPPVMPTLTPVRVRTARFARYLPHIKNPATMGALHLRRRAHVDGFDDVLFVGADGLISEGSTWNIVFLDRAGTTVFPVAPMLLGTTLQVIRAGSTGADRAVGVTDLADMRGAALTSSISPARPIAAIDDVALPVDAAWIESLREIFAKDVPEVV